MMKLIVSLLLVLFTSISYGASCAMNTKLSDTCGRLTVRGVNNGAVDGKYERIDDCLFQKEDGSANYISYWGGNYIGTELGDRRCLKREGPYTFKFDASFVDDLIVGEAETFEPEYPDDPIRSVTISCDTASVAEPRITPAPTPAPEVERVDDLCIIVSSNTKLKSGSGIVIQLPELAGNYEEILGGKNGKPAWRLDTEGPDCDADETGSTLMYVPLKGIEKYMFVRDSGDAFGTYYFSCETDDILADGCPGSLEEYIGMSIGATCECGLTRITPAPTPAPEVERVDDLCIEVSSNIELKSGSGIVIQVPLLAGEYEEILGGKNGKPAWKLVSECGTESTLMYVPLKGIEKYMFVRDSGNAFGTYYFSCETDDILADGCPGSLEEYIGMSIGGSCECGLSGTVDEPAPIPAPEVMAVDSLCLSTKFNLELTSGSGIVIQVPLLAGEYEEISGGKNDKPAWKLVSECGTESTLMYVPLKGIEKYMFVRDNTNAFGTYYFSCETDDILTDGCPGSLEDYIGLSTGTSCVCGLS